LVERSDSVYFAVGQRRAANRKLQEGLYKLYDLGLLHESMEAVVLQEKLVVAHQRLEELDYFK